MRSILYRNESGKARQKMGLFHSIQRGNINETMKPDCQLTRL